MMIKRNAVRSAIWAAVTVMSVSWAAEYYVDGQHADASDANPGTIEQPWKTLAHAGRTARAGDHVYIRGGVYRETLTVAHSGAIGPDSPLASGYKVPDRIVFEAYGDEKAIIDGSEIIPAGLWQPVEGSFGVYVADLNELLKAWLPNAAAIRAFHPRAADMEGFVFFNEVLVVEHKTRNPETGEWFNAVPGADDAMTRYYDPETGWLYVNLGGTDPRATGVVEMTVRTEGVWAQVREYVTLRKLTIRRVHRWGIEATRSVGLIVEDCHIHHVATGFRAGGDKPIVRRNRIHHTINRGTDYGGSFGALIYGNIVSDFGLARRSYQVFAYQIFGAYFARFFHNIAYQSPAIGHGGGFWPDVTSVGHIWRGNAGIRAGYYIESPPLNNLVQWNTALYASIHLRDNYGSTVAENLVAWSPASGLILGPPGGENTSYLRNWLKGNRTGISVVSEPGKPGIQHKTFAQANIYEIPAGGFAANWAGRPYRTLEEFRAVTGQETLGVEGDIDLDELPLVWVRLDGVEDSHKPFPLFGNPSFAYDRMMSPSGDPLFFWWRGNTEWNGDPDRSEAPRGETLRPRRGAVYAGSRLHDPYSSAPVAGQTGLDGYRALSPVSGTPVGGRVYTVAAYVDHALDDKGFGLWSPSLPTVSGATIDIEFWMSLMDVEPVAENGGATVFVEWTDWTRQNRVRAYLVGGDDGDSLVRPDMTRGNHDWTRVAGSVTAPQHARRFALFLGMRGASGQAMYDAIKTIRTRPGEPPDEALADKVALTDPPLVDPAKLDFSIVDLSAFVNRALEDDEADDGQGGWTDQGPGYDMRGLDTGLIEHEGVPYKILHPQSCVVLHSRRRPQSRLPEAVTIPVGEKADVLYFLHSGAWISPGGQAVTLWTYQLHYDDGSTFEIPILRGVNIRDWSVAGLPYEFLNTDMRRATVWPQIIGNVISPDCGLYILEHLNPYPERSITSIRFVNDERQIAVPILLNITLGRTNKRIN